MEASSQKYNFEIYEEFPAKIYNELFIRIDIENHRKK